MEVSGATREEYIYIYKVSLVKCIHHVVRDLKRRIVVEGMYRIGLRKLRGLMVDEQP